MPRATSNSLSAASIGDSVSSAFLQFYMQSVQCWEPYTQSQERQVGCLCISTRCQPYQSACPTLGIFHYVKLLQFLLLFTKFMSETKQQPIYSSHVSAVGSASFRKLVYSAPCHGRGRYFEVGWGEIGQLMDWIDVFTLKHWLLEYK